MGREAIGANCNMGNSNSIQGRSFYHEDDQVLEQVAQRGTSLSILEETQSSTGWCPEHPAVFGPALSSRLD